MTSPTKSPQKNVTPHASPRPYSASPYLHIIDTNEGILDRDNYTLSPSTILEPSNFDYDISQNIHRCGLPENEYDEDRTENTPLLQKKQRIAFSTPPLKRDIQQHSSRQEQSTPSSLSPSLSPLDVPSLRQDYVVQFGDNSNDNDKHNYETGSNNNGNNIHFGTSSTRSVNEGSDSDGCATTNTSSQSRRGSKAQEDVCFPRTDKNDKLGLDYEALEEHVREQTAKRKSEQRKRQRRLSEAAFAYAKNGHRYSHTGDSENKEMYDSGYRYTFYSTAYNTVHARSLSEIPPSGTSLSDMLKSGCWWIDVLAPSDVEMRSLGTIFGIHPLTVEDIETEDTREKCELFKSYYFICFRSFDQDHYSPTYLQPISIYIVVMKEGILSFHYRPSPHPANVRRRIRQLKDYITVTPDWISYALIDDITDLFAPIIRSIEFEVDSIDELVLILKESEQSDMLRRIGHCRKKVMGLLRLLGNKADVMKGLIKRCSELRWDVVISNEIVLYLGDIQDHIITMVQNLNHYEKILSRSHSNYLAQISIEMTQANNQINDILSRLTALGTILIPMNLVTGLWGMNVEVPGQPDGVGDLGWFFSILTGIIIFAVIGVLLAHRTGIV
ncbi:5404_t:CDS:2 [Ambispora leptoticha]|uniref:5404_t:CDS:1 n=1 Tax=Ambispora leptoticha TaxID=144679 RepID=A0A9N9AC37_9GLOM|nr:5404_t:CDS:2 [Ambispora leptoticha]